jgi:hypothetical protein
MFGVRQIVCDAANAGDAGSGGGAAPASAPAPAAPTALSASAGQPAAPTPAASPAAPAAPAAPSALAAAAEVDPIAWAPEKYRVMGADGKLDEAATARKTADGYRALEKRLGSGDVAPSAPTEYKVAPPDALKDTFKGDDPLLADFLKDAHAAGMTQKQVDAAMGAFFKWAPQIQQATAQLDHDGAVAKLAEMWPDAVERRTNSAAAYRALHAAAGAEASKLEQRYGNDPDFIRLLSHFGREMQEDRSPGAAPTGGPANVNELLAHPAYSDPKHPQHESISAQVRTAFERMAKAGQR